MSSPYTPNSQTRQQLDELDALLQRMLALPLTQAEAPEAAKPAAEPSIPLPPTRNSFPQPVVRETAPTTGAPGQPAVQSWRVEMPAGMGQAERPQSFGPWAMPGQGVAPAGGIGGIPSGAEVLRLESPLATLPAPAPLPPPMIFGQPPQPLMGPEPVLPAFAPPAAPAPAEPEPDRLPPLPVVLWPVFVLNWVFDTLACAFGPFGRWLTYRGTKNFMAFLGVVMMLAAVGWSVAEWYGFDWPW